MGWRPGGGGGGCGVEHVIPAADFPLHTALTANLIPLLNPPPYIRRMSSCSSTDRLEEER